MTPREERGLIIAAKCKLKKSGGKWTVPSQTKQGMGRYTVDPTAKTCTCPDHIEAGQCCKHIYAVLYTIEREYSDDGMITETETLTIKQVRKATYPQNWSAYNSAQTQEKSTLQFLLHELCQGIPELTETVMGRPRLSVRDGIFCAVFKVYSMLSSRRFTSDVCDAQAKGYISRVPHFNSVLNVFDLPETGRLLTQLIAQSAVPMASLESKFAVDSTGFSGSKFDRWFEYRWGTAEPKSMRSWVKCHAMIGCLTNVVTSVEVLEKQSGDAPLLPVLMKDTAKRFKIGEVSADMAYLSESNLGKQNYLEVPVKNYNLATAA